MNTIPKLAELLQHKTTFILGAGASKDYGFPLWEELRGDLYEYSNKIGEGNQAAVWWSDAISKELIKHKEEQKNTVDELALLSGDGGLRFFQNFIFSHFCSLERRDDANNERSWIEGFLDKYCELIKNYKNDKYQTKLVLENLNIVSFNYERCFAKRFSANARDFLFQQHSLSMAREHLLKDVALNFNKVIHPHGSLGAFVGNVSMIDGHSQTPSNNHLKYGELVEGDRLDNLPKAILPVDTLAYGSSPIAYNAARNVIASSQNIVIIGMSKLGMTGITKAKDNNAYIQFRNNSKIYTTDNQKFNANFITLGCKAHELVEAL